MKKKWSLDKGFSKVRLNWDAVRSFISDVEVKDKISAEKTAISFVPMAESVIVGTIDSLKEDNAVSVEEEFTDNNLSTEESSKSLDEQCFASIQKEEKEELVDIVEAIDSCEKVRRSLGIGLIARVHCIYDGNKETFWFTSQLVSTLKNPELRKFGRFVPKYSDVAVKLQTCDVGTSFQYNGLNNIKRIHTYNVSLENRSDLQNQTIVIAGDDLTYQYRNINEFLKALQQNQEEIKEVLIQINELRKLVEDLRNEKDTAKQRRQITLSIKEYQKEYRILAQQQEDLKNITIYIRKQGEMRYSHIVDPVQTRIMSQNCYDGKTVIINGGPGTGKTTTMIHRLAYLTDIFALDEDEKKNLNNYRLNKEQRNKLREAIKEKRDWMFFSPSKLLKEYLAEAMRKEGLANTSEKVWNWTDYCRMILQENYHLLEMKGSNAPFKVCKISDTLFYQNSDIINVFTKFYIGELRTIKSQLPQLDSEGKVYAWTNIALKIKERFDETDNFDLPRFISLFNALESLYGNDCKELLRNRNAVLSELANEICDLLSEHNEQKK